MSPDGSASRIGTAAANRSKAVEWSPGRGLGGGKEGAGLGRFGVLVPKKAVRPDGGIGQNLVGLGDAPGAEQGKTPLQISGQGRPKDFRLVARSWAMVVKAPADIFQRRCPASASATRMRALMTSSEVGDAPMACRLSIVARDKRRASPYRPCA